LPLSLYEDPGFAFRFAEDRSISRFHLEGIKPGRRVVVHKIDPVTSQRLDILITATVGGGGWVDLPAPLSVKGGEAFVAICAQRGAAP